MRDEVLSWAKTRVLTQGQSHYYLMKSGDSQRWG